MGRAKIDNPANRHAAFSKRRANLFKKARELSVLCDAEVAIIIISADGKIYKFASSSMQKIITRFRRCLEAGNRNALQAKPESPEEEVPKDVGLSKQKTHKLKSRKLVDKDFAQMSLYELNQLEGKLSEGMCVIKDTKIQLLREELELSRIQSKMEEQQLLQKNQMLSRQIEELTSNVPSIYYLVPSFAAPLAITGVPVSSFTAPPAITDGNLQVEASLPQSGK